MATPRRGVHHRPRRGALALLFAILAIVLGAGGWLVLQSMMDDDPGPQPIPTATPQETAVPTVDAVTAEASPDDGHGTPESSEVVPGAGSLTDLLRYSPDRIADGSLPLPEFAMYADITAWLAMQGQAPGTLTEEQAASLALPAVLTNRGFDPIWEATYGFALADLDQVLAIGSAPDTILVMRGRFDPEALTSAWVAGAYQAVALNDEITVWTVDPREGGGIDLSNPSSVPAMAALNTIYQVNATTLIATATFSRMEDVAEVIQGDQPSLAQQPTVRQLLALETPARRFVSAVLASGDLLEQAPSDVRPIPFPELFGMFGPEATPVANTMPQASMCLFGLYDTGSDPSGKATPTAGTAPDLTIGLAFADEPTARTAIPIVEERFATEVSVITDVPYAHQYTMRVADDTPPDVVAIRIGGVADWLALIANRDFVFLTWRDA